MDTVVYVDKQRRPRSDCMGALADHDLHCSHMTLETFSHIVRLFLFQYERGNPVSEAKIFAVPDFIGFVCRQIGK